MQDFLGAVVGGLLLVVLAIWLMSTFPGFFFAIAVIVGGVFLVRSVMKQNKEDRARREEEAAQERARREREAAQERACREREAAKQREYERQIAAACNDSLVAFENIPRHLLESEELLDLADAEFDEGAFSPFWDSTERAMRKLGVVDSGVKLIADRSEQYKNVLKSYSGRAQPFPLDPGSARRIGIAKDTAGRLQKIVRKAQRNFQFATIYEQRKTNEILIAGFATLGEAIYGLGTRLEQSIGTLGERVDELSSSMAEMNERVVDAVRDVSSAVGEVSSRVGEASSHLEEVSSRVGDISSKIRAADSNAQAGISEQARRQEKANKMLDNIQRHRVPPPLAEH